MSVEEPHGNNQADNAVDEITTPQPPDEYLVQLDALLECGELSAEDHAALRDVWLGTASSRRLFAEIAKSVQRLMELGIDP